MGKIQNDVQKYEAAIAQVRDKYMLVLKETLDIILTVDDVEARAVLMHSYICSDHLNSFTTNMLTGLGEKALTKDTPKITEAGTTIH